ncbi:MAG: MarR family winged helix-turn-helix transcriptional regulator [bacterium]|jgi:MarR family 2-MHQ and catechol resistance regulon transcriptional repressor|nr:MarR family transcriptional regulator [Chitinophagaceae bacterium]
MGLEKDINQQHFTSENQKLIINLLFTNNWLTEKIKDFLSAEDITLQQFNILRILRGSHPQPLSTLTIRERMLDKMSDTSRIVDRLLLKGLVSKKTCPSDKRLVDISITAEGKKVLAKIDRNEKEMIAIMANLDQQEMKLLNGLLDKMRGSFPL